MTVRPVLHVVTAHQQREGGGSVVRRPFPTRGLDHFDPLLMLDEMGPVTYGPGEAVGAPDHPHRGFETVTYLLDGEAEHADSAGHAGTLRAGDVQDDGGVRRGPPRDAVGADAARGRADARLPAVGQPAAGPQGRAAPLPGDLRRLAAGGHHPRRPRDRAGAGGRRARGPRHHRDPHADRVPPLAAPARRPRRGPGADADHRVGVYVFEGSLTVGDARVDAAGFAVLGDGDSVALAADGPAQALVLGGRPIGEPSRGAGRS